MRQNRTIVLHIMAKSHPPNKLAGQIPEIRSSMPELKMPGLKRIRPHTPWRGRSTRPSGRRESSTIAPSIRANPKARSRACFGGAMQSK